MIEQGTVKALRAVITQVNTPALSDRQAWSASGASKANFLKWKRRVHNTMLYDVDHMLNDDSFDDLEDWLQRVHEIYTDETTGEKLRLPQLYIIGNKIDLISERQVTDAQHDAWWRDHGIHGGFLGSGRQKEPPLRAGTRRQAPG